MLQTLDSDVKVEFLPKLDSSSERTHFHAGLFAQMDVVLSAGGDWDDRRAAGALAVQFATPLIDVGVNGLLGHVQSIVPHLSESYACSNDASGAEEPPFCVLKSFPFAVEHAAEWARNKTAALTQVKPEKFNAFWKQGSSEELAKAILTEALPEHAVAAAKLFADAGGVASCSTWADCVSWARNKFEKYFSHKAKQLITSFPIAQLEGKEEKHFWTFPKRAPEPLTFDAENDLHLGFVSMLASSAAAMLAIPPAIEVTSSILSSVRVAPFVPSNKKIVTDESVSKTDIKREGDDAGEGGDLDLRRLAENVKKATTKELKADAVANGLKEKLSLAMALLRCQMYGIPTPSPADLAAATRESSSCVACPLSTQLVLAELVMKNGDLSRA